ncbi:hypothetical protein PFISCL1PPCAC_15853, partial [Pristionchus fissidentatus]
MNCLRIDLPHTIGTEDRCIADRIEGGSPLAVIQFHSRSKDLLRLLHHSTEHRRTEHLKINPEEATAAISAASMDPSKTG